MVIGHACASGGRATLRLRCEEGESFLCLSQSYQLSQELIPLPSPSQILDLGSERFSWLH